LWQHLGIVNELNWDTAKKKKYSTCFNDNCCQGTFLSLENILFWLSGDHKMASFSNIKINDRFKYIKDQKFLSGWAHSCNPHYSGD
jgi:hypothetical protein